MGECALSARGGASAAPRAWVPPAVKPAPPGL